MPNTDTGYQQHEFEAQFASPSGLEVLFDHPPDVYFSSKIGKAGSCAAIVPSRRCSTPSTRRR